jgi:hypothetical protein
MLFSLQNFDFSVLPFFNPTKPSPRQFTQLFEYSSSINFKWLRYSSTAYNCNWCLNIFPINGPCPSIHRLSSHIAQLHSRDPPIQVRYLSCLLRNIISLLWRIPKNLPERTRYWDAHPLTDRTKNDPVQCCSGTRGICPLTEGKSWNWIYRQV